MVHVPKPMPPCPGCGRRELVAVELDHKPHCDVHTLLNHCPEGHARCEHCGARSCVDIARSLAKGDEALALLRAWDGEKPS